MAPSAEWKGWGPSASIGCVSAFDERVERAGPEPRPARAAVGRPPTTTRQELERTALRLFSNSGFDETTVDDIAAAAGIGRRTFFRYFASKNDIVWGEFHTVLARMRQRLREAPPDEPMMQAVRHAVVAANRYGQADLPEFRTRLTLIMTVPTLQSHSVLRWAEWRRVVAEFVAERLGQSPEDLVPLAVGYAALGVALAASEDWARRAADTDLPAVLDVALAHLADGFAHVDSAP